MDFHVGLAASLLMLFSVFGQIRGQCDSPNCEPSDFLTPLDPDLVPNTNQSCYTEGSQLTLSCPGNYGGPPGPFTCNSGSWGAPSPSCDAWTCGHPDPDDADVIVSPDETVYNPGEIVTYSCPVGRVIVGFGDASCDESGWNPSPTPSCIATCVTPVILNGNLTTDGLFLDTDEATVHCYPGYDLQAGDSSTITCVDGSWDDIPACYARCATPAVANSNTTTSGEIKHGETLTIECDTGYSYAESTTLVLPCSDGQLSGTVPSQCFLSCPTAPPSDEFVVLDPQGSYHYHEEEVQYSCPIGLYLTGSNSAQCLNGSWYLDDGTPSCEASNEVDASSVILFCGSTYFQVDIPDSMVVPAVRETDLYFAGDPYNSECRGFRNGDYITLNTSLTGCGTAYSDNNNMSFYQNAVEGLNMDNSSNAIVEYMDLEIPITCEFERSAQLQAHFSTVNEILVKREKGTFQYDFSIYENVDYSQRHNAYPVVVSLGSELYFRAELLRSPGNLQIHLRTCRATPTQNYDDPIMYPIISNGCGVEDAAVRVLVPEQPTQADFEILSFRFAHNIVHNNPEVWIHCEVILCDVDDVGSECSQGCEEPRSRRSVGTSYQRVQRMAQGPIILGGSSNQYGTLTGNDDAISSSSSSASTALFGLISLTMFVCIVAMGVVLTRVRQRLNQHHYQPLQNPVAE